MVRAMGEQTFQPKIGFKTRYGMVKNPFVNDRAGNAGGEIDFSNANTNDFSTNQYYRKVKIDNLM